MDKAELIEHLKSVIETLEDDNAVLTEIRWTHRPDYGGKMIFSPSGSPVKDMQHLTSEQYKINFFIEYKNFKEV